MSLPSLPDKENIPTRDEVVNLIISSIAMEELGLSHIINAEGEKLQYALGTIKGVSGPEKPATIEDLLELNKSIHQTLNGTMMNQFFLKEKLQNALSASIMQGPTGPSGPQGPATIGVSSDVGKLKPDESPTVENVGPDDENVILKFGIPQGATGAVGTILNSYDSLIELEAAHPTGNQGDAYLVGGKLYIWNVGTKKWEEVGDLQGPTGSVGTILASYEDIGKLKADHPSGNQGDAYLVGPGDLYIWDEDTKNWVRVGNLMGPTGPAWTPGQNLFSVSGTTGPAEGIGLGETLSFKSGTLDITVTPGPTVNIETPTAPASSMIAFSTGREMYGALSVRDRAATNVIMIDFGSSSNPVSITAEGFTLPGGDNYFLPFTLAHDIKIKSIYFTTANWYDFNPGTGTSVFPYIILATAAQGENNFTFIQDTKTVVDFPWQGGTEIQQNTTRYGSEIDIDQTIRAGTRLAICCAFDTTGGDFPPLVFGYYFYFSGSIYYELV